MLLDTKRFLDCNPATLAVFRVPSVREFCQKHPADLSPARQPDGSDSMRLANQHIATALREGSDRFEWMHQRADGELFPAEVVLSAMRIGGRSVLQAVVRDMTERQQVEDQLRAEEEKLRTISDATLDAVIMMDSRGRAIHWNPAAQQMFGYEAEEILGREIHPVLAPDRYRQEAHRALEAFFRSGQGRAVGRILELLAVRKSGEEFPIEISLAPIRVEGQWGAVAVVRDITQRKKSEQALREEQRSLRRLLRSHDQERKLISYEIHDGLAQQLVAALYQCQAARRRAEKETEESAHALGELQSTLQQCLAETRRLISGMRPPALDEFGVVTAVQGLVDDTASRSELQVVFHHDVAFERLDPILENAIYRIVQEGLANAVRHSRGTRVVIELEEAGDQVEIRVQDDGVGFDPAQVDAKRFGLAGIRERARLLGGQVTLRTAPGEGTRLLVRLPRQSEGVEEAE
jgi:two-component system sensor kinase